MSLRICECTRAPSASACVLACVRGVLAMKRFVRAASPCVCVRLLMVFVTQKRRPASVAYVCGAVRCARDDSYSFLFRSRRRCYLEHAATIRVTISHTDADTFACVQMRECVSACAAVVT